jgi:DNA-directed RNA polymerase subunit RPC12/RpoP
MMKQKNKLARMRLTMILTGIPVTAIEWVWIALWIIHGYWWLFSVYLAAAILWGIWISVYYFKHVAYICPECHEVFRPRFRDAFFAYHTPKMRRLTCPHCGHRGMCVEIYSEDLT